MRVQELRRDRLLTLLAVAGSVVVLDLVTKAWAARSLVGRTVEVIPVLLSFGFTENYGAAFSFLQGAGTFLALAALFALGVIVVSLWSPRPLGEVVGLSLIAGGAAGNLIDRLARGDGLFDGPVIDWIMLPNFPVFNLADTSITFGVVVLLVVAWRSR
ncbi:MAG TPA: signal peptidase II [Acidimicrobiia bacterium]|nr:signal peptidase II [Acidimicrobiia bacterium]